MTTDLGPDQELNKQERLMALVRKRRDARTYDFGENAFPGKIVAQPILGEVFPKLEKNEYSLIGDYHNGIFDDESFAYVSPYTKGANKLNANIMIILQDWSSDVELRKPKGSVLEEIIELGRNPKLPTNINLERYLEMFNCSIQDTYTTNLLPFIKGSDLSADIPNKVLYWAAKEFALPQIEIIQPKIVICGGIATFNAVRKAYKLRPLPNMSIAMDEKAETPRSPFPVNDGATMVWCQAHPGGRGVSMRGGKEKVRQDWMRMRECCDWLDGHHA
jgi:uracil-DNA glycosylase